MKSLECSKVLTKLFHIEVPWCLLLIMIHKIIMTSLECSKTFTKLSNIECPDGERRAMNRSIAQFGITDTSPHAFTATDTAYHWPYPQLPNPLNHGTVQQPAQP